MDDRVTKKRQSILAAAAAEFGRQGYEGTSMDRIAEASGASKRTVYNHFASKEILFQALVDAYGEAMHGLKQVVYDPSQTLEDQLVRFLVAELALWTDPTWKDFARVLLALLLQDPGRARALALRYGETPDPVESWIRAATADKRLAVVDPVLASKVWNALVSGAFTWPFLYQGTMDQGGAEALKQEIVATFLGRYRWTPGSV